MYFESSSYAWPKSGSLKPFTLLSTGSAVVLNWYNTLTGSAEFYDINNNFIPVKVESIKTFNGGNLQSLAKSLKLTPTNLYFQLGLCFQLN